MARSRACTKRRALSAWSTNNRHCMMPETRHSHANTIHQKMSLEHKWLPCQTHGERLGEPRTRWRWLLGGNDGNARGDQDGRGGEHGVFWLSQSQKLATLLYYCKLRAHKSWKVGNRIEVRGFVKRDLAVGARVVCAWVCVRVVVVWLTWCVRCSGPVLSSCHGRHRPISSATANGEMHTGLHFAAHTRKRQWHTLLVCVDRLFRALPPHSAPISPDTLGAPARPSALLHCVQRPRPCTNTSMQWLAIRRTVCAGPVPHMHAVTILFSCCAPTAAPALVDCTCHFLSSGPVVGMCE
jgi:hypothetical protein